MRKLNNKSSNFFYLTLQLRSKYLSWWRFLKTIPRNFYHFRVSMKPQNTHAHAKDFHTAVSLLRGFFLAKNFIDVHPQSRLSILAACEDPSTITTFEYQWQKRPLPQTGQMWLEHELLQNPSLPGVFCVTTSYRQEPNPVPWRHELIFPMFEFELHGGLEALIALEKELLFYLWLTKNHEIASLRYDDGCAKYWVETLEHEHEAAIAQDISPICLLTHFPYHTSPFWNMKREWQTANKVDVLLRGMETIGSAERSCSPEEMRHEFHTISNGMYAQTLYDQFGVERVEAELEQFLHYDFFPRAWGGIWMTRMIRALREAGVISH